VAEIALDSGPGVSQLAAQGKQALDSRGDSMKHRRDSTGSCDRKARRSTWLESVVEDSTLLAALQGSPTRGYGSGEANCASIALKVPFIADALRPAKLGYDSRANHG